MSTLKDFTQYKARLQSEFIKESNEIEETYIIKNTEALDIYNSTITQNKKQYDTAIENLRSQYNKILKELERLIDSYNLSIFQLNSVPDMNINSRLKNTLCLTEQKITNINLYIILEELKKPTYLYKLYLSEDLSKKLIPDIRPTKKGNYILTIKPDHISQKNEVLTINSQMTPIKYYYCAAQPLDKLIIYTHESTDNTDAYYIRVTTMEYFTVTARANTKYMFLNNKIVAYNQYYIDNYWRFDYFNWNIPTLNYTITTEVYKNSVDHFDDNTLIFPVSDYDAIFYINNNNLYKLVRSNTEIKEQFVMTLDLPFIYHEVQIVWFTDNILVVRTVAHVDQVSEYKAIYVPESILYKILD